MMALIRKADNQLSAFVNSTDGYDLALYDVVPFDGDPFSVVWDGTALVPRPPTPAEQTLAELESDPRWVALKSATPDDIEAWLAANVTTVAGARHVFKLLLLAVQHLAKTR